MKLGSTNTVTKYVVLGLGLFSLILAVGFIGMLFFVDSKLGRSPSPVAYIGLILMFAGGVFCLYQAFEFFTTNYLFEDENLVIHKRTEKRAIKYLDIESVEVEDGYRNSTLMLKSGEVVKLLAEKFIVSKIKEEVELRIKAFNL